MKNKLNKFTENLLRLSVLERTKQLEERDSNINLIQKELECLEMIDDLILYANSAPKGLIEIVITDKQFKDKESPQRILQNSVCKISAFNVADPEAFSALMRTVIVVDPKWSNNFTIYHCQYGFGDSHLKLKT